MNTLTVYGVMAVVVIALVSNNASALPTIEDKAERVAKFYDERTRNEEKNLADEINIVFADSGSDIELPQEITHRRQPVHTRKGRNWQQNRDRRQSWNPQSFLDNFFGNQPQDIYGSMYDAYGSPPTKIESRNFYQYPTPTFTPFNPPQYLPPPIQPTTVNNYYFIGIPIAPWRVDNPWLSAPFFFPPICSPSQTTTPEPQTTPPITNIDQNNSTNGSGIIDRFGPIWGDNNNGNGNKIDTNDNPFLKPNYQAIASPIDLTPAKPKRPLSRPPPEADHKTTSNTVPTNNVRRPTNSRPRRPTVQSQVSNINTNKISSAPSPFEDRISTPAPENSLNSDPPSRCINAIITCCRPNSSAYSQTCFENLGCNGIFWDGNPCGGEVAKAAMNVYNIFRNRFQS